jgi:hypothetical protein
MLEGVLMYRSYARILVAALTGASLALSGCAADDPVDQSSRDSGGSEADATTVDATDTAAHDTAAHDTAAEDVAQADTAQEDAAQDTAGPQDTAGDTAVDVADDVGEDTSGDAASDASSDAGADTPLQVVGDTCATAIDVTSGGIFATETTTDATDDYDASLGDGECPNGQFSGKDKVYALSPTVPTSYEVSVDPVGNFDPFIYTRDDCSQAACLDGTVFNGPGGPESLTVDVAAGETVFVIVDGELGSEGDYSLGVLLLR